MPLCEECGSFVEDTITKCPFCGNELEVTRVERLDTNQTDEVIVIKQDKTIELPLPDDKLSEDFVLETPELEDIITSETDEPQSIELDIIPERKYIYWLLLGLITVGIGLLIYLFINIEDLDKHSQYPNDPRGEQIIVNTNQTLLFFFIGICFGVIPVIWWVYYKKYDSLYTHLRKQRYELAPRKIPRTIFYMIPLVTSHLLALVPAIYQFVSTTSLRFDIPALFWSIVGLIFALSIVNLILDFLWQRAFNAHNKITITQLKLSQMNAQQT
jgi:hypothetical protein